MKRFNEDALQNINYIDQITISYFISNVHREKPYYYFVKLKKIDILAEMMEIVQNFTLTKDEEDKEN